MCWPSSPPRSGTGRPRPARNVRRRKQAFAWLKQIEMSCSAIVLLLLVGEGSVVAVLRRLIGG